MFSRNTLPTRESWSIKRYSQKYELLKFKGISIASPSACELERVTVLVAVTISGLSQPSIVFEYPFNNDFGSFTDCNNSTSDKSLIKLIEADGDNKFASSDGYAAESDLWQKDFKWTYIVTHETDMGFGPYFMSLK